MTRRFLADPRYQRWSWSTELLVVKKLRMDRFEKTVSNQMGISAFCRGGSHFRLRKLRTPLFVRPRPLPRSSDSGERVGLVLAARTAPMFPTMYRWPEVRVTATVKSRAPELLPFVSILFSSWLPSSCWLHPQPGRRSLLGTLALEMSELFRPARLAHRGRSSAL